MKKKIRSRSQKKICRLPSPVVFNKFSLESCCKIYTQEPNKKNYKLQQYNINFNNFP
jgi:hypothetical protein